MGTVRRALEVYAEDGTTELFERGLYKLAARRILSRRVIRRDRLKCDCVASDSLWTYTPAERFHVKPPGGETPPETLREASGAYECAESFVCELQNVRLLGEHALTLLDSGNIAVEPHRPIEKRSRTFEVRFRDTCLQLGTSRVLRELMARESGRQSGSRMYDTAAHFVMRVPTNFGHWVLEYLPKIRGLWHYQEMTGREPVVLVDPDPPDWMTDSLALFGISSDQWVPIEGNVADVRTLVVPNTRYTHSYDYEPSPADRQWLRDEATRRLDTGGDSPKRVYISRQRRDSRRIVNFDEVSEVLASYGVEPIEMESLDFSEQVRVCAEADLIVGPHGSGFANAIWAHDATVLELHPPNHVCVDMFLLSRECELAYDYILCEDAWTEEGDNPAYRNLTVDPGLLESKLESVCASTP